MKKALIAYQIYSARDEASKDLLSVLKQLKDMDYDGVEFAGFYGHSVEDVAAMLAETGLRAISSHVPFQSIVDDMFGTIAYHLAIGCSFIAIPYLDEKTRPGSAGFASVLRKIYQFWQSVPRGGHSAALTITMTLNSSRCPGSMVWTSCTMLFPRPS